MVSWSVLDIFEPKYPNIQIDLKLDIPHHSTIYGYFTIWMFFRNLLWPSIVLEGIWRVEMAVKRKLPRRQGLSSYNSICLIVMSIFFSKWVAEENVLYAKEAFGLLETKVQAEPNKVLENPKQTSKRFAEPKKKKKVTLQEYNT